MRLIDADALKEKFNDRSLEDFTHLHFIDAIDNAPTIEEKPTGFWINRELPDEKGNSCSYPFYHRFKCSLCGECSYYSDYCPNCGAKMIKEESES